MAIEVIGDIDLSEEQKVRLLRMIRGNGHVDHENRFEAAGETRTLAAVRFLSAPLPDVPFGDTCIDGVDGIRFERPPYLYLEAEDGAICGWRAARDATPSAWHYGVLFQDAEGQAWFCGRDEPTGGRIEADAPILRRVSMQVPDHVLCETGPLEGSLPAEGEFWLTQGEVAVVTSIPWWGGLCLTDEEGLCPEAVRWDRRLLEGVQRRVGALRMDGVPEPG